MDVSGATVQPAHCPTCLCRHLPESNTLTCNKFPEEEETPLHPTMNTKQIWHKHRPILKIGLDQQRLSESVFY